MGKNDFNKSFTNFLGDHATAINQQSEDHKRINKENKNFGDRFVNQLAYNLTPTNTPMYTTVKSARKNKVLSQGARAIGVEPVAKIFEAIGFGNTIRALPSDEISILKKQVKKGVPVKYYARGGSRIKT